MADIEGDSHPSLTGIVEEDGGFVLEARGLKETSNLKTTNDGSTVL